MRTPLHRLYRLRLCGWTDIDLILEKGATDEDIRKLNVFETCKAKKFRKQSAECGLSMWNIEKLHIAKNGHTSPARMKREKTQPDKVEVAQ